MHALMASNVRTTHQILLCQLAAWLDLEQEEALASLRLMAFFDTKALYADPHLDSGRVWSESRTSSN
jgi:hypothetical protein